MNLYDLSLEFRAAADKLADLNLDEQTLLDTLESLSGDLDTKVLNTVALSRNMDATAKAIKEAEAEMAKRRQALENRVARLKDHILASMMVAGIHKIESPYFRISVRDNPPAVEIYEPGLIPAEFMRQPEPPPPAPDKKAIAEALKSGREVAGCKLTVGKRLEIR